MHLMAVSFNLHLHENDKLSIFGDLFTIHAGYESMWRGSNERQEFFSFLIILNYFLLFCDCLVSYKTLWMYFYMAVSYKDWELPNSQIWLAEIDIESGLHFPVQTGNILQWKICKLICENIDYFLLSFMRKEKYTRRADFGRIRFSLQVKCQLLQTSFTGQIKLFVFGLVNKHLIDQA